MASSSSSSSPFGVRSTGFEEDGDGRGKAEKLCQDLIVEILVRLPVKTLLRFKSVSKLWYSLITSPNFIALHSTHSYRKKKVSLLFLQMVYRGPEATASFRFDQFVEDLTIPFRESDVEIVGCFNGAVCLSLSYDPQMYALWNPATRQLREIEVPKKMAHYRRWSRNGFWSGNCFCFDPVANSFTVASIALTCAIGEEEETRAHIIQFSTATNSWTQKSMGVPFRIWETGKRYNLVGRSISCVNRYIHCRIAIFRDSKFSVADDMYILSYDMIGGIFERIEMPFPPIRHRVLLANCSGSLALFGEDNDAWVMNDCGGADQSWSKLVTCKRPSKVGPLALVEVFIESNNELVIVRKPREMVLELCYPYRESLASLY